MKPKFSGERDNKQIDPQINLPILGSDNKQCHVLRSDGAERSWESEHNEKER